MLPIFRKYGRATLYLMATDVLAFFAAFGIAMRLRFRPFINVIEITTGELIPEASLVAILSIVTVPIAFNLLKLYQRRIWLSTPLHGLQLVKGVAILLAGYLFLQYFTKSPFIVESRLVILAWGVITLAGLALNRLLIFRWLMTWAARSEMHRRIALIGANDFSREFAAQVRRNRDRYGMQIVGFVDDMAPPGSPVLEGIPCLGPMSRMEELADLHNIEGAVITAGDMSYGDLMDCVERCVRVFGWVDVHADRTACLQQNLDPDTYFEIPFIRLRSMQKNAAILFQKRLMDVVGAGLGILILSPVFLLTALLVRLTSRGPILYTTERIGLGGRGFRFFKFRTMVVGADRDATRAARVAVAYREADAPGPSKLVNRALLTPIGGFLRKWAIDELPQLFNVLKGDMSLVGPRPLPRSEYDLQDEWQKKRFEVSPGCTGLWKIYASWHKNMPFSQSVLYDIYYARNANPLLDIAIILKTVIVILAGKADG
jgi:exopolysaccharide biosynthesis polyprenyl glycosylphosphotransferase